MDPALASAFFSAYRQQRGLSADWPNPIIMWGGRFIEAMAIIPYAQRMQDMAFLEHARQKLQVLETEAQTLF